MENRKPPQSYRPRTTSSSQGLHVFALQIRPITNTKRKDFRGFEVARVVHAWALQSLPQVLSQLGDMSWIERILLRHRVVLGADFGLCGWRWPRQNL